MESDNPIEMPIEDELDLHTFSVKEITSVVEEYLYQCSLKGFPEVRIIHGKGIGTQRKIVHAVLKNNPHVLSFSEAPSPLGGWGATMVKINKKP
jgi:dsDNA-specific endonuclease/ATPase MutS2